MMQAGAAGWRRSEENSRSSRGRSFGEASMRHSSLLKDIRRLTNRGRNGVTEQDEQQVIEQLADLGLSQEMWEMLITHNGKILSVIVDDSFADFDCL
jgi:hypothetical protein